MMDGTQKHSQCTTRPGIVQRLTIRLRSIVFRRYHDRRVVSRTGVNVEIMRIGILGGTFDPVHLGHLVLAEQCRDQCRLDEVWFVPAGEPPHKSPADITPSAVRLELLEFAIAGHERFRIQRVELDRTGPSFTVETLERFHQSGLSHEYFLLLGADSVRDLPQWREPHRILQLATVVAVNRGNAAGLAPEQLAGEFSRDEVARIQTVSIPGIELSSRDIRANVRSGRSIRFLVPRAVEIAIAQKQLYRDLR